MKFDAPLGIPQGSVRAILTIVVMLTAAVSVFVHVDAADKAFIFTLTGTAFGHYFGARQSETAGSPSTGDPTPQVVADQPESDIETSIVPGE